MNNKIRSLGLFIILLISYASYELITFGHKEIKTEIELQRFSEAGKVYELQTGKQLMSLDQLIHEDKDLDGKFIGPWIKGEIRNYNNEIVDCWGIPYKINIEKQTISSTGFNTAPYIYAIWKSIVDRPDFLIVSIKKPRGYKPSVTEEMQGTRGIILL